MTPHQRVVLFLLAIPFSGSLAIGAYLLLDVTPLADAATAVGIFIGSELLLHHLASRIRARTGTETLPGRPAEVITAFESDRHGAATGYVQVHGERWRARIADASPAPAVGERVRVERVDGLTLWVTRSRDAPRRGAR